MKNFYALVFIGLFGTAVAATETNATNVPAKKQTTGAAKKVAQTITKKSLLGWIKKHPWITAAGAITLGNFVYKEKLIKKSSVEAFIYSSTYSSTRLLTVSAALAYIAANYNDNEINNQTITQKIGQTSFIKKHAWGIAWSMAATTAETQAITGNWPITTGQIATFENTIIWTAAIHYLIMQLSDDNDECGDEAVDANVAEVAPVKV
ncbi:MAG: hypothetical protein WCT20_00155 [Candidatus Babeliales bacterium]